MYMLYSLQHTSLWLNKNQAKILLLDKQQQNNLSNTEWHGCFTYLLFFLGLCIIMGKQPLPHRGLIYWPSKFVLATLIKGYHMIIYVNL